MSLSGLLGPKEASPDLFIRAHVAGMEEKRGIADTLVDSQPLGQRLYRRFYVTARVVGGDNPCAFDCPHPCWGQLVKASELE